MTHRNLEVADIVRRFGEQFTRQFDKILRPVHRKALRDIAACRTAELGGHVNRCNECGHSEVAYNSCRNRNCPKCQAGKRAKWMADRESELLPVPYFHVVFTLPSTINSVALQNPKAIYSLLFQAVSRTLIEVAETPKHLGAKIGFLCVLHTWGQNLMLHPHLHCVVPAGGLAPDKSRWIKPKNSNHRKPFLLPVRVLSRVFRGKFIAGLKRLYRKGELQLHGKLETLKDPASFDEFLNKLTSKEWVVYSKPPFGGPVQVLKYLSRYTHRVAISNSRIRKIDKMGVAFQYKDYAKNSQQKTMRISGPEFLRRFCMHILPSGFMRIRSYGWMANRNRKKNIELCRSFLGHRAADSSSDILNKSPNEPSDQTELPCPVCKTGRLIRVDVAVVHLPQPSHQMSGQWRRQPSTQVHPLQHDTS